MRRIAALTCSALTAVFIIEIAELQQANMAMSEKISELTDYLTETQEYAWATQLAHHASNVTLTAESCAWRGRSGLRLRVRCRSSLTRYMRPIRPAWLSLITQHPRGEDY